MSDKIATISLNMSYHGPWNQSVVVPASVVLASYQASSAGQVDVPAGALDGAEYDIPFGSIGVAATSIAIKNNAGQEVEVFFNSAATSSFDLPAGGVVLVASSSAPDAKPITSIKIALTAAQVAAGTIDFLVVGDPE